MSSNSKKHSILRGLCPQCGESSLYKNLIMVSEFCPVCGLQFQQEKNDAIIIFCVFLISTMTIILAALIEVIFTPPPIFHIITWIPVMIASSLLGVRLTKASLIIMRYQFNEESKSNEKDTTPHS